MMSLFCPENGSSSAKKSRRKSGTPAKPKKAAPSKESGAVSSVLHKLCSVLASLKELLPVAKLVDSNRQLLACYHLSDEVPKQIQILTALILQLIQCSVTLTGLGAVSRPEVESSGGNDKINLQKVFEHAMEITSHFWQHVLQRWAAPKAPDGADVKGIVDNLLVDLLTILNVPEFPAAKLLLQVFCVLLFGTAGIRAKDAVLRGTSVDLLGQVAARLKEDAVACSKDKLWILQELSDKDTKFADSDLYLALFWYPAYYQPLLEQGFHFWLLELLMTGLSTN